MKLDDLIDKYVQLRNKKAEFKAAYDEKVGKIDEALDKIEQHLMKVFNETGQESAKTAAGTAYKQRRFSASVADWPATLEYIQANERWDLLEKRVAKKVIEEMLEETGEVPPGISTRTEFVINVRSS